MGQRDDAARVLLLALDGFPPAAVTPGRTPALATLAQAGGQAQGGGLAALPATTYPGFASLLTGAGLDRHGVRTTAHRPGAVPGWAGRRRVQVPTLIDAARAARIPATAVLGDHHLHRVLRLGSSTAWPPRGRVPEGTPLDAHGYPTNVAVRGPLLAAAATPGWRLLFAHLNEVDTLGHDGGPSDPATLAALRSTDEIVGELLDALRADWARTLVVVVSDHGMEASVPGPSVDVRADPQLARWIVDVIPDGGCAWARLRKGVDVDRAGERCAGVDGVGGWLADGPRGLLLTAERGRRFSAGTGGGVHGGPRTARTLAIVGGGHPSASAIAAAIADRPPRIEDWAPTIARVLDLELPCATGVSLIGRPG